MYTKTKAPAGHIEPRKNTKGEITHYRAVINYTDENGIKRKPYKKAATKDEAEALLIQMKAEFMNGEFTEPNEMRTSEYLETWYNAYVVNQRSESTVLDYREIIDRYLIPTWGNIKLQALKTISIQMLFNTWSVKSPLSDKPLAVETLKHIRRVFNTALNKAVEIELLKRNPLKGVTIGRDNSKKEIEVFSEEEIQKLFQAIKGTDNELIVAFLFDTLARRSEALGARWSDLNMKTGTLTIQHTYIRTLDGCKFKDGTKSQSSKRSMVLTDYTLELLRKEKFVQMQNKLKLGEDYEDNDLIICQPNGKPYQGNSFTQKWSRLLKKNGIRHIKLHGSRHSAISMMVSKGIFPKYVQERAGHKSCDITMNIYTHVSNDQKIKTAKTINDEFFKIVVNN